MDSMYYVKAEGEGLQGIDLVDNNAKVTDMIRKYEGTKKFVLTMVRNKVRYANVVSSLKSKNSEKCSANFVRFEGCLPRFFFLL